MIKEWNLLRSIACLSIVFLHSTTQIGKQLEYPASDLYPIFRATLCFATPTFIILSEIILSNKYKNDIPKNFFKRRIKLILGPFITFAILDALVVNYLSTNGIDIGGKILNNLLGGYEGYFILIIFQFYILHFFIIYFKISVERLLPISITIMIIYLYLLNSNIPFITEYKVYLKLPFTAWFGYFTVAFLIGKYYDTISNFLRTNKWTTLLLAFFSIYLLYMSFNAGVTAINSRRLDIFPLAISISLIILAWGQILPNYRIINLISNYSLGIYLIHWQVQSLIAPSIVNFFNYTTVSSVLGLFTFSLVISIVIIKILSFIPFGKYMIGNTKRNYSKQNRSKKLNENIPV